MPVSVALSSSYGMILLSVHDNICCTTCSLCCYDNGFHYCNYLQALWLLTECEHTFCCFILFFLGAHPGQSDLNLSELKPKLNRQTSGPCNPLTLAPYPQTQAGESVVSVTL